MLTKNDGILKNHLFRFLYLIIILEFSFAVLTQSFLAMIIILILALMALVIREYRNWLTLQKQLAESRDKDNDWVKTKSLLERILVSSNILPVSGSLVDKKEVSQFIDSYDQVKGTLSALTRESIEILRAIGINGLLISIFLLQQGNSFCSVKIIQKALKMPLSTVYRMVQKLEEYGQIVTRYVIDSPNKAYYKLSPSGESLILELYELLGGDEFVIA